MVPIHKAQVCHGTFSVCLCLSPAQNMSEGQPTKTFLLAKPGSALKISGLCMSVHLGEPSPL